MMFLTEAEKKKNDLIAGLTEELILLIHKAPGQAQPVWEHRHDE